MTCKECILAKYCTGIGQCAENQRKLKENLVIHPNGISEQIKKRICETDNNRKEKSCSMPEWWSTSNGDLNKELNAIKERLDEIAGIKQTQLFRLNRNLIKRGVAPRKLRRLLEEAYATTAHPETLLDEYLWKYAR